MKRILIDFFKAIFSLKNDLHANSLYLLRGLSPIILSVLALIPAVIDIAISDGYCESDLLPCFEDMTGPIISFFIIILIVIGWHLFMLVKIFTSFKNCEVRSKNVVILLYPYLLLGNWVIVQFFTSLKHDQRIASQTYQVECQKETLIEGGEKEIQASFSTNHKNYVITALKSSKRDKHIRYDSGVVRLAFQRKGVALKRRGEDYQDVIPKTIQAYEISPGQMKPVALSSINGVDKVKHQETVKQGVHRHKTVTFPVYRLPRKTFPFDFSYDTDQTQLIVRKKSPNEGAIADFDPLYGYIYGGVSTTRLFTGKEIYYFVEPKRRDDFMAFLWWPFFDCEGCLYLSEFREKESRVFRIKPSIARQLEQYRGNYRIQNILKGRDHLYVVGKQQVFYFEIPA